MTRMMDSGGMIVLVCTNISLRTEMIICFCFECFFSFSRSTGAAKRLSGAYLRSVRLCHPSGYDDHPSAS